MNKSKKKKKKGNPGEVNCKILTNRVKEPMIIFKWEKNVIWLIKILFSFFLIVSFLWDAFQVSNY